MSLAYAPTPPIERPTASRIVGFDLARAYAIFGMYIVNFNVTFGNYQDHSGLGQVLALFSGNSSSLFVMLAGMGVALLTRRAADAADKKRLRRIVRKRALVLLVLGLLLMLWWPADILHFYAAYMDVAALVLFVPKRYWLWGAAGAVLVFHLLLLIIPYERGWNFATLTYTDFWTPLGFVRNTLYNGWNPVFPWLAFFLVGMWLGRLDWQSARVRLRLLGVGLAPFALVQLVQAWAGSLPATNDLRQYLLADYLPPTVFFQFGTAGFGLVVLVACMSLPTWLVQGKVPQALSQVGRMTLTHYISHLSLGLVLFALATKTPLTPGAHPPVSPGAVLLGAVTYYALSVLFSYAWSRRWPQGPLETLLRRLAG